MKSTEKDSIYYLERRQYQKAIIHMAVPMIHGRDPGPGFTTLSDAYFIGRTWQIPP